MRTQKHQKRQSQQNDSHNKQTRTKSHNNNNKNNNNKRKNDHNHQIFRTSLPPKKMALVAPTNVVTPVDPVATSSSSSLPHVSKSQTDPSMTTCKQQPNRTNIKKEENEEEEQQQQEQYDVLAIGELIPTVDRFFAAIKVFHVAIDDVPSSIEQEPVELRLMVPKAGSPNPGHAVGRLFGNGDSAFGFPEIKMEQRMSVE